MQKKESGAVRQFRIPLRLNAGWNLAKTSGASGREGEFYGNAGHQYGKHGENIRRLRKEKGMSVRQVRDKLNLAAVQSIYQWEKGETLPGIDNMFILAELWNVHVEDILVMDMVYM